MFDDVGNKVKTIAVAFLVIGIIFSFLGGIMLFEFNGFLAILVIIFGSIMSYLSSVLVYAFGQLVSNTDILVKKQGGSNENTSSGPEKFYFNDKNIVDFPCPNCGESVSFSRESLESGMVQCPYCDKAIRINHNK